MRRAEIVTAFILGILSIYLMWKSGEAPDWNPDIARFDNIGLIEVKAQVADSGHFGCPLSC
jgi:hypothetical protein